MQNWKVKEFHERSGKTAEFVEAFVAKLSVCASDLMYACTLQTRKLET